MRYAGYEQEGRLAEGGWTRGVLRNGGDVLWRCTHEHGTRDGAVTCTYHAEYVATLAGLLPEPEQARWLALRPRPRRRRADA